MERVELRGLQSRFTLDPKLRYLSKHYFMSHNIFPSWIILSVDSTIRRHSIWNNHLKWLKSKASLLSKIINWSLIMRNQWGLILKNAFDKSFFIAFMSMIQIINGALLFGQNGNISVDNRSILKTLHLLSLKSGIPRNHGLTSRARGLGFKSQRVSAVLGYKLVAKKLRSCQFNVAWCWHSLIGKP